MLLCHHVTLLYKVPPHQLGRLYGVRPTPVCLLDAVVSPEQELDHPGARQLLPRSRLLLRVRRLPGRGLGRVGGVGNEEVVCVTMHKHPLCGQYTST